MFIIKYFLNIKIFKSKIIGYNKIKGKYNTYLIGGLLCQRKCVYVKE